MIIDKFKYNFIFSTIPSHSTSRFQRPYPNGWTILHTGSGKIKILCRAAQIFLPFFIDHILVNFTSLRSFFVFLNFFTFHPTISKWLNKKPPVQADVQRSESTAHEQYK